MILLVGGSLVNKLFDIFKTCLGFFTVILGKHRFIAGLLNNVTDELFDRIVRILQTGAEGFDQTNEAAELCGTSADIFIILQGTVKAGAVYDRIIADAINRGQTDAALWHVDNTLCRDIIHAVFNRSKVG